MIGAFFVVIALIITTLQLGGNEPEKDAMYEQRKAKAQKAKARQAQEAMEDIEQEFKEILDDGDK